MEEQVDWATHLSAIEAEGISVQAYARREALSAASLYYWRRRRCPPILLWRNWWPCNCPNRRT